MRSYTHHLQEKRQSHRKTGCGTEAIGGVDFDEEPPQAHGGSPSSSSMTLHVHNKGDNHHASMSTLTNLRGSKTRLRAVGIEHAIRKLVVPTSTYIC